MKDSFLDDDVLEKPNVNYTDTRRVSIGAVYNFGKASVRKVESRQLGNEDLIDRAAK